MNRSHPCHQGQTSEARGRGSVDGEPPSGREGPSRRIGGFETGGTRRCPESRNLVILAFLMFYFTWIFY